MKKLLFIGLMFALLTACSSSEESTPPTRVVIPTETATETLAPTLTEVTRPPLPASYTPTLEPQLPTARPVTETLQAPTQTLPPTPVPTWTTEATAAPIIPNVQTDLPIERIRLPPGFRIHVYAQNLPRARQMTLADDGTLFVGSRGDSVYAVRDTDGDYYAETVHVLADGLFQPNGVAYRDNTLWVMEIDTLLRFDNVLQAVDAGAQPRPTILNEVFYPDTHHGMKVLRFGPDGLLYFPQGSPCNVCEQSDDYGFIARMNPDGTGIDVIARGIRNSVGFDWSPVTGNLWFTDNGRDWLGNDAPAGELNNLTQIGQHFGFPFCQAGQIIDPEFGYSGACEDYTPPAQRLGPHVASLGMRFYTGAQFPAQYVNQIFIAEHGSWNRDVPIGYRVSLVRVNQDQALSYETFAEGWLNADGSAWGRPVDVQTLPDGSLLVSDDAAGAIYRIVYTG